MDKDKKFALLIDAENTSAKYLGSILKELLEYGTVTYKRAYGDFTDFALSEWNRKVLEYSIVPIQQPRYRRAKNAADIMLVIDAMDILHSGKVDGFCIVSSDSDFTRLVNRLREEGIDVIGIGKQDASKAFKAACTEYKSLQIIYDESTNIEDDNVKTEENMKIQKTEFNVKLQKTADDSKEKITSGERQDENIKDEIASMDDIKNLIYDVIRRNEDKGKDTGLGEIGSNLLKTYSDFDVRNYGYKSLTTFVQDMKEFSINKIGNSTFVTNRVNNAERKVVEKYIKQTLSAGKIAPGLLGQRIHNKYPEFNVQKFGYSKFESFVCAIDGVGISVSKDGKSRYVVMGGGADEKV